MLFVCHPKILHKHRPQFLLGVKTAPRETENSAYANVWGDKQRELWYVRVFSGVVNPMWLFLFFIFLYDTVAIGCMSLRDSTRGTFKCLRRFYQVFDSIVPMKHQGRVD